MRLTGGRLAFVVVAVFIFVADRITTFWNVPNCLTLARLCLTVGLYPLVWLGPREWLLPVFLIASVAVSIGLMAYVVTHHNPPAVDAILGLILGGTIGNGYDRIMYGTVTDFIALHFWPVFNVADSAVSVGVVLIALGYFVRAQPRAA